MAVPTMAWLKRRQELLKNFKIVCGRQVKMLDLWNQGTRYMAASLLKLSLCLVIDSSPFFFIQGYKSLQHSHKHSRSFPGHLVLQYEELILRKLSKFQQIINLNPGSKVENFYVTVRAVDEQGITFTNASSYVGIRRVSSQDEVIFSYSPSLLEQVDTSNGLARDMFVEYDVNRPSASDRSAGLLIVNDCYFAQFFSPSGVERVPIDIIFVIDVSGSILGTKIDQTRVALETIIIDNQLIPGDRFSMVTFHSVVNKWRDTLVSVSEYRQEFNLQEDWQLVVAQISMEGF